MRKAKFVGKIYSPEGFPVLTYLYRGRKYDVIDYGWRGGEPLSWQHKNEQAHIDDMIDKESKSSGAAGEPAEIGFEIFWESVNQ